MRRKVHTQQQHNLHESRSHCASEPRLNETETPPQRRRASQKRPTHTQSKFKTLINYMFHLYTTRKHHECGKIKQKLLEGEKKRTGGNARFYYFRT